MCDTKGLQVGGMVPDFQITAYRPDNHDFAPISLAELMLEGKWTILFFYPADFTFV